MQAQILRNNNTRIQNYTKNEDTANIQGTQLIIWKLEQLKQKKYLIVYGITRLGRRLSSTLWHGQLDGVYRENVSIIDHCVVVWLVWHSDGTVQGCHEK